MTNKVDQIPMEIWMNVFGRLDRIDVCQCRLVCRKWSQPAERALFSLPIYVFSRESGTILRQILLEKPYLARLIKHLHLCYDKDIVYDTTNAVDVLRASFTSSMERVSTPSPVADPLFFAALTDIAARSPDTTEYRLKTMPQPATIDDEHYIKAAYTFRNTLQKLSVWFNCKEMDTLLDRLTVFNQLETLYLRIEPFEGVYKLETVLRNCPRLVRLQLTCHNEEEEDDYMAESEHDILKWAAQHVKQVKSLKELRINKAHLDLVHYLIYKYPQLQVFTCHGLNYYDRDRALDLLTATKTVPAFQNSFFYHLHPLVRPSIADICSLDHLPKNITARIAYGAFTTEETNYSASLTVASIWKSPARLHFRVELDRQVASESFFLLMDHFKDTRSTGYTTDHLIVDAVRYKFWDMARNDNRTNMYYIFNNFTALKRLSLAVERIQHEPDAMNQNQLESLRIEYAVMDAQVLPHMSQLLPNLCSLELYCCTLLDDMQQRQEKELLIHLPHSSLAHLDITFEGNLYVAVKYIRTLLTKCRLAGACYLQVVILEANVRLYCRLEQSRVVHLSREEYETRADRDETLAILVTCAYLAHLSLDFRGVLLAQVDVEELVLQELESTINMLRASLESQVEEQPFAKRDLADLEERHAAYFAKYNIIKEKLYTHVKEIHMPKAI